MRIPLVIVMLCGSIWGQTYSFSTNASANPFGISTTVYMATFNLGSLIKTPGGDCIQSYYQGSGHVVTPSWIVMQRQAGCSGAWTPYSGTAWDLAGDAHCDGTGTPAGCAFSDNVNLNSARGCSFLIEADGSTLDCMFFSDIVSSGHSAGLFVSKSTDDGLNFSRPVQISNFYWVGQGFVWGSKSCFYAGGNHPNASQGSQYVLCTSNHWATNDGGTLINSNLSSEGTCYSADGTNGICFSRSPANSTTMQVETTANGGATWAVSNSNVTATTPNCPVTGGTLSNYNLVSPGIYVPSSPSGRITLSFSERQVCSGGSLITNNFLRTITFQPSGVISDPTTLPSSQTVNVGYATNASVDYGYQALIETSGSSVLFSWYGDYTIASLRPAVFQMTGSYVSSLHSLAAACGGTGNGALSSGDGAIACICTAGVASGSCSVTEGNGTQVVMTATASAGSAFSSVSGGGCSSSPCTVTVNSDSTITASFGPLVPTLVQGGNQTSSGTVVMN